MPKSCFLFTFSLVCVLWFTVYEVESGQNDLEYWKPTRPKRTTTVRTDDSTDDSNDYDSTEQNDSSGVEGNDNETHTENEHDNERRRKDIETNKGKRYHTQGRKKESTRKPRYSKVHTKQSIVQKHKLRTSPTEGLTQKQSRITRVIRVRKPVFNTKSSVRYRAQDTKEYTYDDDYPSVRHKLRTKFEKKIHHNLRSTRMPPNYEMQQLVDDDDTTTHRTTTKKKDGIPIEELSPFSIARQLPEFKSKFPEANITHEIIGRTAEFNDIVLLRVTETKLFKRSGRAFRNRANEANIFVDEPPEKKIVFIVHGLSVMGFNSLPCFKEEKHFTTLLSYYYQHLDKFDIFLIPMANPDGVALNRPFWNKNNSPQTDCPGVSLDRNFDVAWNASTKLMSSCTQRYPGPAPFSEPETVAIRELFHRYSNRIVAYLHVHAGSYYHDIFKGDAILYPKGHTEVQTDDDKYIDLKGDVDEAMKNASFRFLSVAVESLSSWYGPISGSSVDYASTIYEGLLDPTKTEDELATSNMALVEIWRRMLDIIFNNVWKYTRLNDFRL